MRRSPFRLRRERGIALLLVLWAFMILGVLALDFGRWMRDDAMAGINAAEETQGYYAAYAGLQKGLWKAYEKLKNPDLGQDPDDPEAEGEDELIETESGTFHGVSYRVEVRPECGRIPINKIARQAGAGNADDREFLKRLITNLVQGGNATQGMNKRTAGTIDEVVDSIIDWVDANGTAGVNGAETKWYLDNRGYPAKNGPLLALEELLQIRGVTADLFYGVEGRPGLRDVVSVFCGFGEEETFQDGKIDGLKVDGNVIRALLPSLTAEEITELLDVRESGDLVGFAAAFQNRLAADPVLADRFNFEPERATLLAITARADTTRERNQSAIAGVFAVGTSDAPEVLMWYDRAPYTGARPNAQIAEAPQ